jgi:hypothetical protein
VGFFDVLFFAEGFFLEVGAAAELPRAGVEDCLVPPAVPEGVWLCGFAVESGACADQAAEHTSADNASAEKKKLRMCPTTSSDYRLRFAYFIVFSLVAENYGPKEKHRLRPDCESVPG